MGGRRRLHAGCMPLTIACVLLAACSAGTNLTAEPCLMSGTKVVIGSHQHFSATWRTPVPGWCRCSMESAKPSCNGFLSPKDPSIFKTPESTHNLEIHRKHTLALKARKRTRGPNEITIQNKAPRQCPGNTPSSKGSGMAPGPCLGAQRRKIRLFKTIDLGEVIYKELATRL